MSRLKKVGVVGVDSGQVMICDPCYIENEWQGDGDGSITPPEVWEDKETSKRYAHGMLVSPAICKIMGVDTVFDNWESKLDDYDGKTPNQVRKDHWTLVDVPEDLNRSGEFSYAGVCHTTLRGDGFGQLKYKMGHDGAGIASRTLIGDGCYPVFARVTDDGQVEGLAIDFRVADYDNDINPEDVAQILQDPSITNENGLPRSTVEIREQVMERGNSPLWAGIRRLVEGAKMLSDILPEMKKTVCEGHEDQHDEAIKQIEAAVDAVNTLETSITEFSEKLQAEHDGGES